MKPLAIVLFVRADCTLVPRRPLSSDAPDELKYALEASAAVLEKYLLKQK